MQLQLRGLLGFSVVLLAALQSTSAFSKWELLRSEVEGVYAAERSDDDKSAVEVSCAAGFPRVELHLPDLAGGNDKKAFVDVSSDGAGAPRSYEGFIEDSTITIDGSGAAALADQIIRASAAFTVRARQEANMSREVESVFPARGSTKAVGAIVNKCASEFAAMPELGPVLGTELSRFRTERLSDDAQGRIACSDEPEATYPGTQIKIADVVGPDEMERAVTCNWVKKHADGKETYAPAELLGLQLDVLTFDFRRPKAGEDYRLYRVGGFVDDGEQGSYEAVKTELTRNLGAPAKATNPDELSEIWTGEVGAQVSYGHLADRRIAVSYYLADYL